MTTSCANCQYWQKQESKEEDYNHAWDAARIGLGECKKVVMLCEATAFRREDTVGVLERILPSNEDDYWTEDEINPIVVELDATQQMYVMDGSQYKAMLYTKPEFFCAHHSPKYNIKADPNAVVALALHLARDGDPSLLEKIKKESEG